MTICRTVHAVPRPDGRVRGAGIAIGMGVLAVGLGGAAQGAPRGPDPCRIRVQTFLSPAGEPFHADPAAPPPVAGWFAQADRDRDGRLTPAEVRADAVRFFATVDTDGNGEIIPDELATYERGVPDISTYRDGPPDRRSARGTPYGTPVGGARYALANVPNPIAAADIDLNRATTRAELSNAAGKLFVGIARGRAALALADLPATPQALMLATCAARAKRVRR
ncbi:EF-hand domain-containing protein [Sphingomonas montana]|uniref:EF-hand domain-containing protein n=1 Tax=Sphingomonas montana TaxID=1843236 RepID=UPI0013EAD72B|nr:EF-hand domain-containing protein [Sphingomonas montana]